MNKTNEQIRRELGWFLRADRGCQATHTTTVRLAPDESKAKVLDKIPLPVV